VTVKIAGQFTKETRDRNGLTPIADKIVADHHDWSCYGIVRLEGARLSEERRDGWVKHPTVAICHIEPVDGDDAAVIEEMLARRYQARIERQQPIPGIDGRAESRDEARVDAERRDPIYGGPIKDDGPDLLTDPDTDGPVAERPRDEWLDKG
jgi:hypothetical protein